MLITSQVPVSRWHEVIGDPTLADAILDRIVHRAHRIELKGPSLRRHLVTAESPRCMTPVPRSPTRVHSASPRATPPDSWRSLRAARVPSMNSVDDLQPT